MHFLFLLIFQLLFSPGHHPTVIKESIPNDEYILIKWSDLSRISLKYKYHQELKLEVPYPVFHANIKSLEGKKVKITGYVIPVDESPENPMIVLSAFPYSSCFFCGGAGPESVMEIKPKGKLPRMDMDRRVTLKGILKLNENDVYSLYYSLNDAEPAN